MDEVDLAQTLTALHTPLAAPACHLARRRLGKLSSGVEVQAERAPKLPGLGLLLLDPGMAATVAQFNEKPVDDASAVVGVDLDRKSVV